jgi:hypothetical protein
LNQNEPDREPLVLVVLGWSWGYGRRRITFFVIIVRGMLRLVDDAKS